MIKKRIASSVTGLAIMVSAFIYSEFTTALLVFLVAAIAIHELFSALSSAGYKPVGSMGYIACGILLITKIENFLELIPVFIFCIMLGLIIISVLFFNIYKLPDIAFTVFGIAYVVFLLSFVIYTRNIDRGLYYVWLIFLGAWGTDTFAFFTGLAFGKTKLLPGISPGKTLEGSIGGIVGAVLTVFLYGMAVNSKAGNIPLYHYVIMGVLSGLISQVGDWMASTIKRFTGKKDFGSLLPGHGGVLDRFDSILVTAPVIYFYLIYAVI